MPDSNEARTLEVDFYSVENSTERRSVRNRAPLNGTINFKVVLRITRDEMVVAIAEWNERK